MKKILTTIWKFINSKIFGYVLILAFAVLFLGTCNRNKDLKNEAAIHGKNLVAMNDTIKTERLKNGELQVSISGYVANAIDLENYNAELAAELDKQKGKVITLNRIVFNLIQDTTELRKYIRILTDPGPPVQDNDTTWTVSWSTAYVYDSINYDRYDGKTQVRLRGPFTTKQIGSMSVAHNKTYLTYRDSQMKLVWGQEWEGKGKNKQLKIYARTNHPAFRASLLDGTYADLPKEKHWLQGWGVGPTLNIGYDFLNNQPAFVVGIGIHYNLYKF